MHAGVKLTQGSVFVKAGGQERFPYHGSDASMIDCPASRSESELFPTVCTYIIKEMELLCIAPLDGVQILISVVNTYI